MDKLIFGVLGESYAVNLYGVAISGIRNRGNGNFGSGFEGIDFFLIDAELGIHRISVLNAALYRLING